MKPDMLQELKKRKSPLIFDGKPVENRKMRALLEAARWAPSCFNNQSWHYVFVDQKSATRGALENALSRGNSWAKRAPYLVAVAADPNSDCTNNNLPYYMYDAGLSVMCLVIEAEHLGLRVHQMAGWDEKKVKKAVQFPSQMRIIVVFALGYEADLKSVWGSLDERTRTKLAKPRERKGLEENFFYGSYEKSIFEIFFP